MPRPRNIAPEAIMLFDQAGWAWRDFDLGFRKSGEPTLRISYKEIQDHHLVGSRSTENRETGLQWLRRKLSGSSSL